MLLFYRKALWRVKNSGKKIYLTFDDGPHPEITNRVLDILKEYKAKATFFCVGENVRKCPDVYNRMLAEGHSTGNHTYNHASGWRTKTARYIENIKKCAELVDSKLFRPPYGRMKPSQYSIINKQYSIVMWDVLSGDFDQKITKEKCLKNVLDYSREGSIVLFHDSIKAKANMQFALPIFLKQFSEKGFVFEKL